MLCREIAVVFPLDKRAVDRAQGLIQYELLDGSGKQESRCSAKAVLPSVLGIRGNSSSPDLPRSPQRV